MPPPHRLPSQHHHPSPCWARGGESGSAKVGRDRAARACTDGGLCAYADTDMKAEAVLRFGAIPVVDFLCTEPPLAEASRFGFESKGAQLGNQRGTEQGRQSKRTSRFIDYRNIDPHLSRAGFRTLSVDQPSAFSQGEEVCWICGARAWSEAKR